MADRHFNPLLDRLDHKEKQSPGYHRSPAQERAIAKRFTGRRVPGSGNGRQKGDVAVRGIVRIEAKTTQNKSFSVTRSMVEQITLAAQGMDEIPAIIIEFLDAQGRPEYEIALVPTSALDTICGEG